MATNIKLKRTLLASLILFAVVGVITFVLAAKANHTYGAGKQDYWDNLAPQRCSLGTLRGAYGLIGEGTIFMPSPPGSPQPLTAVPLAAVDYHVFDGNGNSQGIGNLSFNGAISHGPFTGVYTVNENCTGRYTLTDTASGFTASMDFVIVDGGKEFFYMESEQGTIFCGNAKRIKSVP